MSTLGVPIRRRGGASALASALATATASASTSASRSAKTHRTLPSRPGLAGLLAGQSTHSMPPCNTDLFHTRTHVTHAGLDSSYLRPRNRWATGARSRRVVEAATAIIKKTPLAQPNDLAARGR